MTNERRPCVEEDIELGFVDSTTNHLNKYFKLDVQFYYLTTIGVIDAGDDNNSWFPGFDWTLDIEGNTWGTPASIGAYDTSAASATTYFFMRN